MNEIYDENNIFNKIINNRSPANVVYEEEDYIVIRDIAPLAKSHFLLIPKKIQKICFTKSTPEEKKIVMNQIYSFVEALNHNGYDEMTITFNNIREQVVFHIHIHFLIDEEINNIEKVR